MEERERSQPKRGAIEKKKTEKRKPCEKKQTIKFV